MMVLPRDLATGDLIDEPWVDAVVASLTAAAVKPSAGVVYGVNMYEAILGATVAVPQAATALLTQAMPAAPAGTLLDIEAVVYMNQGAVGTGSTFMSFRVNGTTVGATCIVGDRIQLESYSFRAQATAPVGIGYNIDLVGAKGGAGAINLTGANTRLLIVSYRP